MTKLKITDYLQKQILFFDGAMGSLLQDAGLQPGILPESWNISNSSTIQKIHYDYLTAGANILKTNTFGAYKNKFADNLEEVISCAITNAKSAINKFYSDKKNQNHLTFIAYDVGPCGKLLEPLGDISFDSAVELFKTSILIALKNNIDLILIETMTDIYETKAAIIASKEAMEESNIFVPIFATNVYDENAYLLTGSTPEIAASILESLQIDAFGINCSLGPKQMESIIPRLVSSSMLPVIVNPNAGLPHIQNNKNVFDITPEDFAQTVSSFVDMGAVVLGGCCGTTPEHIKLLVEKCKDKKPFTQKQREAIQKNDYSICSSTQLVQFNREPILIGERINPTGKKLFKEALRNNDISYIINEGLKQEEAFCHVLDVNVGLPEIDETKMMVTVIKELQSVTELPLQIDTTEINTMEKALRIYNGKALVNSVNGKQEVMNQIFPLVKKYGGMIIALTLDENGIPETPEERVKIAKKIINEAKKYGINKKDIIIDPLAMTISTNTNSALTTLNTIKILTEELQCKTSLGVSNISFGLPKREIVTSTFFSMALQNGLSAAIMNPLSQTMMDCYKSFCALSNFDEQCINYIDYANKRKEQTTNLTEKKSTTPDIADSSISIPEDSLKYAVLKGLKENAAKKTIQLLQTTDSLKIIDQQLIPALDIAGKNFENKKIYLPQLLMCAEAAKSSFNEIRNHLLLNGQNEKNKGTIILATVKGDIHDIGKNIVKVLLENYSYKIIDLGKDVAIDLIIKTCKENQVKLVGLSALMTTTVPAMEQTIKQLKKHCPNTKICVGGAVLTEEYANMIGADFYGKDAMETVKYANRLFCN